MDTINDWPFPPLHEIIKRGLIPQIRFLIDMGADIDETDKDGRSAAILCALVEPEIWGVGLMRILIEKGADLSQRDFYSMNILHYCMVYERVELTKVLLKAIDFDLNQADKEGNTALHYAVRSGNPTLIRMLCQSFKKYKVNLDKPNRAGVTPLQDAYNNNKLLCAKILEASNGCQDAQSDNDRNSNYKVSLEFLNGSISSGSTEFRSPLHRPKTAFSVLEQRQHEEGYRDNRRSQMVVKKFCARQRPPNIRDQKNIIQCASLTDFRNSMEYILYLSQSDNYDSSRKLRDVFNRPTTGSHLRTMPLRSLSWRSEFKKLYSQFEFQCSSSFRSSLNAIMNDEINELPSQTIETPSPPEMNDDDKKHKRGRRMSEMSNTSSTNSKRRTPNPQKAKRGSINPVVTKQSTAMLDGSLASSNESLNSTKSLKRKESTETLKKDTTVVAGRQSRIGSHRAAAVGDSMTDDLSSHGSSIDGVDQGTQS